MSKPSTKITITPQSRGQKSPLKELWDYRQVAFFFAWRNFKVRYQQAALGIAWVVLQPLLLMLLFCMIFAKMASVPGGLVDYRAYILPALIAWQLFSRSVSEATVSVLSEERIVTKIFFPRALLPLASLLGGLPDLFVLLAVGGAVLIYLGISVSWWVLLLPIAILTLLVASYGVSLWFAALVVDFRDIQYTMPFITQILFFLSPIIYAPSTISEEYRTFYVLNPFCGPCALFRLSLLGVKDLSSEQLVLSLGVGLLLWIGGLIFFFKREKFFVDKLGSGG